MRAKLANILSLVAVVAGFYYFGAGFSASIVGLCFLIFFHELGHFLAARALGIEVQVFSVGFGTPIYARKVGATVYQIASIPFGGYVKIKGQEDESDLGERSYARLPALGKIIILSGGVVFNFFIAFVFYVAVGMLGEEVLSPKVGKIAVNSSAFGKIMIGDEIKSINGIKIQKWQDIKQALTSQNAEIIVRRGHITQTVQVKLKMGDSVDEFGRVSAHYILGVLPSDQTHTIKRSFADSLSYATHSLAHSSMLIAKALYLIAVQDIDHRNLGGMIMLSDVTSKSISISLSTYLLILAAISVNLGVVNLLPIPPLDGGHIFMQLYELVLRRKAPQALYNALSYIGLALLLALMAVANINDVFRYIING